MRNVYSQVTGERLHWIEDRADGNSLYYTEQGDALICPREATTIFPHLAKGARDEKHEPENNRSHQER